MSCLLKSLANVINVVAFLDRPSPLMARVAFAVGILPSAVYGQSAVRGVVVDHAGRGIEGVHLTFGERQLSAETGAAGEFLLSAVSIGQHTVRLRRLGFRPDSQLFTVPSAKTVLFHAVMASIAIEIAPIRVVGRRASSEPLAGFYARRLTGSGRFFTSEDIDRRNPSHLTDLLRSVPGFAITTRTARSTVRIRGSRCAPVVFLDGQSLSAIEFDLDGIEPHTISAMEVYSGSSSVPIEFQRDGRVNSNCGTILIWTKRGELSAKRNGTKGMAPTFLIERMIGSGVVVTAADVDTVARIDSSQLIIPVYPSSLFEQATSGRVLAEFVVASDGDVDMQTFSAVTSTHSAFVEAVRNALSRQHFFPAWRAGKQVHQVMQLPFEFIPDSTLLLRWRR